MIHKISDILTLADDSASGNGLAAKSYAAGASNGAGIDTTLYEGGLAFALSCGTIGASATVDLKIQDSADNSTFADLATPLAITQLVAAGFAKLDVRTRQTRRYVRFVMTVGVAASVVAVVFVGQKRVL